MGNINSQVNQLNSTAFNALKSVKNPEQISAQEAKNIRTAILQDGKIDAAEKDLLTELTQDSGKVKVSASADFGPSSLSFGVAKGEAKKVLETLAKPENLNSLWEQGAKGWEKLIDLASASPTTKSRVTNFIAGKLYNTWQQSSITNGYKPIRDAVVNANNLIKTTDAKTVEQGREILYDAMKLLDKSAGDSVPDFTYNWLNNK